MKMKKFMNAPETVTDEELVGLGLAYPDILNVDGHLVISKDLTNADRVTIVTYGGSGHEPAQAGFVGKGMLDIQAVGDICLLYTSPCDSGAENQQKGEGVAHDPLGLFLLALAPVDGAQGGAPRAAQVGKAHHDGDDGQRQPQARQSQMPGEPPQVDAVHHAVQHLSLIHIYPVQVTDRIIRRNLT